MGKPSSAEVYLVLSSKFFELQSAKLNHLDMGYFLPSISDHSTVSTQGNRGFSAE